MTASRAFAALASLGAVAIVGVFAVLGQEPDFLWPGAIAIGPLLAFIGLLMAVRLSRAETDVIVRRIIVASVLVKVGVSLLAYWVAFVVYGGSADAVRYGRAGEEIARGVWSFDASVFEGSRIVGTRFIEIVTGLVYAVTGPSMILGFLVFALLGWFGTFLLFRAFRVAVPTGDRRLAAVLLLLTPSMLYWPASVGKESWMMLSIGVTVYGLAKFFRFASGLPQIVLGLLAVSVIRPHITVLLLAGGGGALMLARTRDSGVRPPVRLLGLVALAFGAALVSVQVQSFFGVDTINADAISQILETTAANTATGGSEFQNVAVTNPLLLPFGFVSVVFRPFPWEAANGQALLLSLESVVLIGVAWHYRRNVARAFGAVRRSPLIAFCLVYSAAFVAAFSNFNNLGLLARERVQVLPFLFMVLAAVPRSVESDPAPVPEPLAAMAGGQ